MLWDILINYEISFRKWPAHPGRWKSKTVSSKKLFNNRKVLKHRSWLLTRPVIDRNSGCIRHDKNFPPSLLYEGKKQIFSYPSVCAQKSLSQKQIQHFLGGMKCIYKPAVWKKKKSLVNICIPCPPLNFGPWLAKHVQLSSKWLSVSLSVVFRLSVISQVCCRSSTSFPCILGIMLITAE